jgi:hypothetical protein
MDTKTGLDVLECEIAQIEATVFTLKRCLRDLRYSIISEDEQMLEDMRRGDGSSKWITKDY